jgi:hypothetical protein
MAGFWGSIDCESNKGVVHEFASPLLAPPAAPFHHLPRHLAVGQPGDQRPPLPRQGGGGVFWAPRSATGAGRGRRAPGRAAAVSWACSAGDRVVLCMQNCPQLVVAHFAILRANAVVVPVNPMNRAEELKHYITDPDARWPSPPPTWPRAGQGQQCAGTRAQRLAHLVVTHLPMPLMQVQGPMHRPRLAGLAARATPLPRTGRWPGACLGRGAGLQDAPPRTAGGPDDLAVLPYTSGTTGLPKGCMHPHARSCTTRWPAACGATARPRTCRWPWCPCSTSPAW